MSQNQNKIQPNRYDKAVAELKKGNFQGVEVPETIPHADRLHYHVLIIESTPNSLTKEFDHVSRRQSFNDKSYEIFIKDFKKYDTKSAIVIHDGREQQRAEDKENAKNAEEKAKEAEAEQAKAEEAKLAEEQKAEKAEAKAVEAEAKAKEAEAKAKEAEKRAKDAEKELEALKKKSEKNS